MSKSITAADLSRAAQQSGLTNDEYAWQLSYPFDGRTVDREIVELAEKKRSELDAAWEGVNRRSELLFGLSVAAIGWIATHGRELSFNAREMYGCCLPFLVSAFCCGLAWWDSGKPSIDLKWILNMVHTGKASTLIATSTASVAIVTGNKLRKKQWKNKTAVIFLMAGVIVIAVTMAYHLP